MNRFITDYKGMNGSAFSFRNTVEYFIRANSIGESAIFSLGASYL